MLNALLTVAAKFTTLLPVFTTVTISPQARIRLLASTLCATAIAGCGHPSPQASLISLDELRITVSHAREISFTNKVAGFYYTVTHGPQTSGWHGWHVSSNKILDDYALFLDGHLLRRTDVANVDVYPHLFTREYRGGIRETVALLDSVNALLVVLHDVEADTVDAWPIVGGGLSRSEFLVRSGPRSLFVARAQHPQRTLQSDAPPWIGMRLMSPNAQAQFHDKPLEEPGRFSPAGLAVPVHSRQAAMLLVAGDSPEECQALLDRLEPDLRQAVTRRRERMEAVLRRSFVRTNDERFDKALHWAMLSLDALIMRQGRPGIYAGLPWFSNYWGRDTFIALPGATLVTGRYEEAREILQSFAQWQELSPRSSSYGRIPNLVTPSSIAYNTADGTPWFVIALEQYYRASGDSAFIRSMASVLTRAVEGTIANHTDPDGFLTHGDAETWMDAVGPSGPWSPRGDRANDIQSLWYRQLRAAGSLVPDSLLAQEWHDRAQRLRSAFLRQFVDSTNGLVIDHIRADGSRDVRVRPNQFFVFASPDLLPFPQRTFQAATGELVYTYGIASLSQRDENFHPYHHYEPLYVQDAAYHNGVVWTWLAGPWIDAAVKLGYQDLAFVLTRNMTHQILERGAVGTLSELIDALPRKGETEPRLSGTFSQAWSLAEFVRVFYQDYLGLTMDVPHSRLTLSPRLPQGLDHIRAHARFGASVIPIEIRSGADEITISCSSPPDASTLQIECDLQSSKDKRWHFTAALIPGSVSEFVAGSDGVQQRTVTEGAVLEKMVQADAREVPPQLPVQLAVPTFPTNSKVLAGPQHRLLSHSEIKASHAEAPVVLDCADPSGDDRGTGTYVYPRTPLLKAGSLDLTHVRVRSDSASTYFDLQFRSLSNPGWHPEYGFQLTFVAIAIDADRTPNSGRRDLGSNSRMVFPADAGFERLILVGGGVRVLDERNAIVAEYLPRPGDERQPLGDSQTGTVSFALPKDVLGQAFLRGRWTILVGAQDDHGGAGLGEFRSVETVAGEWNGGGRRRPSEANVYDTLTIDWSSRTASPFHN
jgi:glycogen debranching enzyme